MVTGSGKGSGMDKEGKFSIGDAVQLGWDTMVKNLGYFILAVLIMWVVVAIPSGLQSLTPYMPTAASVIFGIIFGLAAFVLGIFVNMAQIKIGLRLTKGEAADFDDLYNEYPHFLDFLVGSILYGLMVIVGLILLIIPGIYVAVKFHFFGYLIIDQDMDALESLRKSWEITEGAWWRLFLLGIVACGIVVLGFCACIVGIFAAYPVVMVAMAYVYRSLLAATPAAQAQPPEAPQPQQPAAE